MAINLLLQVFYLCQEPLVHEYLKTTVKTTEKQWNFRKKHDCKVYKAKSKFSKQIEVYYDNIKSLHKFSISVRIKIHQSCYQAWSVKYKGTA